MTHMTEKQEVNRSMPERARVTRPSLWQDLHVPHGVEGYPTTGSPGTSAINLTSPSIDTFSHGCSRVQVGGVAVEGVAQAVLIDAGCTGNIIDADLWSYVNGDTGISATP